MEKERIREPRGRRKRVNSYGELAREERWRKKLQKTERKKKKEKEKKKKTTGPNMGRIAKSRSGFESRGCR